MALTTNNNNNVERQKVSPYLQLFMTIVAAGILMIAFHARMLQYRTSDEPVVYETLTPRKLLEFGGPSQLVDVGLHIDRFQQFDIIKNDFEFTGSLWFLFEAGTVPLKVLEEFIFYGGTILDKSAPEISIHGTKLLANYMLRVKFSTGLNFKYFPLDDHDINLILTNPFVSPDEIVFTTRSSNFTFGGNLKNYGWADVGHFIKAGFIQSNLTHPERLPSEYHPLLGFSISAERYGYRYVLAILFPIILVYLLMFFVFSLETHQSVGLALTGITVILAYRYVIEAMSPMSGDMMLSDHFFFMILTSAMFILVLNQIDLFLTPLPLRLKKLGILAIHIFTCSASIYLLAGFLG